MTAAETPEFAAAIDRAAAAAKAEFTRAWGPEVPDDLWHRVAREVVATLGPAASPWRPISEAPRDRTIVLLAVTGGRGPDEVVTGYWNGYDGEWWLANTDFEDYTVSCIAEMMTGKVTHWMPRPAPPTGGN